MDDIRLRLLVQTIQLTLIPRDRKNNVKHLKAKQGYRKIKSQFSQAPTTNTLSRIRPSAHSYRHPPPPPLLSILLPAVRPSEDLKMSFAVVSVMALMCSSVVIAFVLQPSKQDDVMPEDSNSRCHSDSLKSIRKELLAALNLQTEPRLPEGAREQWRGTAERLKAVTVSSSSSSDDGRDTSGCCAETSEVSMTELGWNNWMIYPERVTLVHCTHCGRSGSCRPQPNAPQRDLQVQAPCCQPTTQEAVPVMYMDEWNTVVITSMHLTRRCGCPATQQPPQE